jgi:STE24 endopeptidase
MTTSMTLFGSRFEFGFPAADPFTAEEIERARRYHLPRYWAHAADLALGFAILAVLAFTLIGDLLYPASWPWWAAALVFPAIVLTAAELVRLPLSYWRGFVHEHRWGFSTQTVRGWLADRAKGLAIGVVLTTCTLAGLVALARAFPDGWPLPAALGAAALIALLVFVAPVVLEPVFHRFQPLPNAELAADLQRLAGRAGVPVREVLVADASRRTRKANAYVSGLGRTRRVVLFDTLLDQAGKPEIELVVAHELGHRRHGDVLKLTALMIAGTAGGVLVLWAVLGNRVADPRQMPLILLISGALELLALPFLMAFSRRLERRADRFSLELTGNVGTLEETHRNLAVKNLADLAPPRALYYLLFSHPTPPERIAAARRWSPKPAAGP